MQKFYTKIYNNFTQKLEIEGWLTEAEVNEYTSDDEDDFYSIFTY